MTTRTRMPGGALRTGREFIGQPDAVYSFVPCGEPVIIGYTPAETIDAAGLDVKNLGTTQPPTVALNSLHAPQGTNWITMVVPLGGCVACTWTTPFGALERWIIKAIRPADLIIGDQKFIERRKIILRVMAETKQPYELVAPVVAEVGREYAAKSIMLVAWLMQKFGNDLEMVKTWLDTYTPHSRLGNVERIIRDELAGTGDLPDYEHRHAPAATLQQILIGARRYLNPKQG